MNLTKFCLTINLFIMLFMLPSCSGSKTIVSNFKLPDTTPQYYLENYKNIKEKGKEAAKVIDFLKFRYSYFLAENKIDSLNVETEDEQGLGKAFSEKDYPKVIEFADKILEKNLACIRAHALKAFALTKLNKDPEFNDVMGIGLAKSIFDSGDGKTPETAFHVFQIEEEYDILKYLGLGMVKQSLQHIGNRSFDILECENENGDKYEIYFDITEHMHAFEALFQ